jgi:hypothetical protein
MNNNLTRKHSEKRVTQNNLLDHLQQKDNDLISPHLRHFQAQSNEILNDHGQNVGTVYFPCGSMLGAGRSYVSRVIGRFKQEDILAVKRGYLVVLNRGRLVQKSCACNDAVRIHFETVLKGIYPDESETKV